MNLLIISESDSILCSAQRIQNFTYYYHSVDSAIYEVYSNLPRIDAYVYIYARF